MSGLTTPSTSSIGSPVAPTSANTEDLDVNSSLEDLQTDEQRRILDTVAQVRKCGLESILSLPQLVVCGDQSAGKSSVLEALTLIPFPRNDNLCTRFATEIILRRGPVNTLTIKVIPDSTRPHHEQETIRSFTESITDFADLPRIMDMAMTTMGLSTGEDSARAFAKDVLSIEIEGPTRPQLTLVDIPGLIQSSTKGVSDEDVRVVAEITDNYISQPRTICLAVVSAMNDAANQPILQKVRAVDPQGDRTLGIITKPDRLPAGSGSESKFLELARNEDVFFKLGWHVLKNRSFEEGDSSLEARNDAENRYFRTSNFNTLPKDNVGIDALRCRLSQLLFEHVKQELPKLRQDLEKALAEAKADLALLGDARSNSAECKAYLAQLSLDYYELCKAGVNGYYEGEYFQDDTDNTFSLESKATISRLRAVIQHMNTTFYDNIRRRGHKFQVNMSDEDEPSPENSNTSTVSRKLNSRGPIKLSKEEGLKWVRQVLVRTRGKELVGNFNPLLIGELFWEQATAWKQLAVDHIEETSRVCEKFLDHLLEDKSPKDVKSRLWASTILDALKKRRESAYRELGLIMDDISSFPINYNHYYTDTIHKRRLERQKKTLADSLEAGTEHNILPGCNSTHTSATVNIDQVISSFSKRADPNMENFSCEDALDCLFAIYKVTQKTFVANITTQVIERHIVRGLEKIFSPVVVNAMLDAEVEAIASEPLSAKRQRNFLTDRIKKLEDGHEIFRGVMGTNKQ
ncbi:related to interferon-induced GTP-binding protein Mx [Rhynchosporium graminicola]|uniref:Related to interferon-induced GTP-binding protein Mx n=1 Tax=Rhynchosporium graminicola TaxID=2792576 RepID=A0A1E1JQM5_9HELO|nr:related to interferon-induced GTP-binding protein Mx [Rhynchosporium commune]